MNYVTAFSFTLRHPRRPRREPADPGHRHERSRSACTRSQLASADTGRRLRARHGPERRRSLGTDDGTRRGVGDMLLRGKYQLPRLDWLRSAAGLQLRLPSGDEDDFQGTGSFEASPVPLRVDHSLGPRRAARQRRHRPARGRRRAQPGPLRARRGRRRHQAHRPVARLPRTQRVRGQRRRRRHELPAPERRRRPAAAAPRSRLRPQGLLRPVVRRARRGLAATSWSS